MRKFINFLKSIWSGGEDIWLDCEEKRAHLLYDIMPKLSEENQQKMRKFLRDLDAAFIGLEIKK